MRVLALEPYYGGSHRAFLDGWSSRSRHDWTILGLPAYKWKWRMRHSAITLAEQVAERTAKGETWDAIFVSDMLNLAEFGGLARGDVAALPTVAYFHENQLTYPNQTDQERDLHFAFTNLTTAIAVDQVWFNSAFHRDSFLDGLREYLPRMPDYQPIPAIDQIQRKSRIHPPGINKPRAEPRVNRTTMNILWAARWEHDKNPEDFFAAIESLDASGVEFGLNVIGEQFQNTPPIFDEMRTRFDHRINRWGFQKSAADYHATLAESDVVVSTANHEFFGIAVLEAVAAGARPLLPRRLSYPEIMSLEKGAKYQDFFFDGSVESLVSNLVQLADKFAARTTWKEQVKFAQESASRFFWSNLVPTMDDALEAAS